MARPDLSFDWRRLGGEPRGAGAIDVRVRTRVVLGLFVFLASIVLIRAIRLEMTGGDAFRRAALEPRIEQVEVPAERGRILARDGTVLACDRTSPAVAVYYPYLADPPDAAWLRTLARAQLKGAERRQPERIAEKEAELLSEIRGMHGRLAKLCGVAEPQWQRRRGRIRTRVAGLSRQVNQRRQLAFESAGDDRAVEEEQHRSSWGDSIVDAAVGLFEVDAPLPPRPVQVAEERQRHVLAGGVSAAVEAEIRGRPDLYPGVKIVRRTRRAYPAGRLAAHVVGAMTPASDAPGPDLSPGRGPDRCRNGLMGLELAFNDRLRGEAGLESKQLDRRGRVQGVEKVHEPRAGLDVTTSIDAALQGVAEGLLDRACDAAIGPGRAADGGAVVVLDVQTGEVLTAASAPRFDPEALTGDDADERAVWLNQEHQPLFDRAIKMAIPPGSVFKTLSAVALLESGVISADTTLECRGYLYEPESQRCFLYRTTGVGHGPVTLTAALAQSCNVFFYQFGGELGPVPLVDWARRFGFGRPSGIELPDEAAGNVPSPLTLPDAKHRTWSLRDSQDLAIGQGPLTVTPLQVARLMAAIANGGRLIRPTILRVAPLSISVGSSPKPGGHPDAASASIDVKAETLALVREGLRRVVADPSGTAYSSVRLPYVAIAGKTGTAETGGGRADHAWFAGYLPAESPRYAFCVALEHGGGGAAKAGPVAKQLARAIEQAYLDGK